MSGNMRGGPITERSRLEISPFTPCQTMRAGWMGKEETPGGRPARLPLVGVHSDLTVV